MDTPIPSNTRVLKNGEVVEIGDYWSVSGNHWTLVNIFHIGDKVGDWPSLTYRRKVKELVTFNVTINTDHFRFEDTNLALLTQCVY